MTNAHRAPVTTPPRIAAMATLPLFHDLHGRKAVLSGSGDAILWKAELLAAAGARVELFSPARNEELEVLAASIKNRREEGIGSIILHARAWNASDFANAAIAIAEMEDDAEAAAFREAAKAAGAIVNVIDRPAFCDAQFGAIVNRSPLMVAISSAGAAPVFAQAVRIRIEALLPRGLKLWAEAARAWRNSVQERKASFRARRGFWERFSAAAFSSPDAIPESRLQEALLSELEPGLVHARPGRITLVGAGPGDPDLLTVKAIRALQSADIILYDDLVSADILELARREAKRMLVGKKGHGPSCRQEDINALMVRLARQGRHVVRLKGGDPLIFGRAGEEIAEARAAGIAVSIVPGVTSAQAAGAALGISLTERDSARRLQFVTGHSHTGTLPDDIDWRAIADSGATTIVYMPRRTLVEFSAKVIAAGLDPSTPIAMIVNASRSGEAIAATILSDLSDRLRTMPEGPMLAIIGKVVENSPAFQASTRSADSVMENKILNYPQDMAI